MSSFLLPQKKMATKTNRRTRSTSSSSSAPPAKRQKITVAPFTASFPRSLLSSSRWVNLPEDIWVHQILNPFLDLKALSTVGRCNTFFEEYWQYMLKQNVIRVPEGCPTMNEAMDLAVIFSERNESSKENPVKIQLGDGEHEMVGVRPNPDNFTTAMAVTCSNVTIVGKGRGKTTILGGFYVEDKQNVKIEQLSVTNRIGYGLLCNGDGTNVSVTECSLKMCSYGMAVYEGATVTATQCEFTENRGSGVSCHGANTKARLHDCKMHHNGSDGLNACLGAVVDLHGTKTGIHSNKQGGIYATLNAKVNIHLPSQHNTSHDNVRWNQAQELGGSIANINADGTFTHEEEADLTDNY